MSKENDYEDFAEFFESKGFEVEDAKLKPRSFFGAIFSLMGAILLACVAGALIAIPGFVYASAAAQLAEPVAQVWKAWPDRLEGATIGERNKITDINGDLIAEYWVEDRIILENLDSVGENSVHALISSEDKNFYNHGAMDVIATVKAIARGDGGGGSGITQQLVKNLQFYDLAGANKDTAIEASIERKLKELKLAIGMENEFTKDEILLKYFNTVSFGSPNIYSIESASNHFFNKPAKDLSIAEAAALIGSVQNPSVYNLESTDEETIASWKDRKNYVIDRMEINGYITAEEAEVALNEELVFSFTSSSGNCQSASYPFYCDYAIDYLMNSGKFGESLEERQAIIAKGGLTIQTYLDPSLQNGLQAQLTNSLGNENRIIAPTAIVQPGTGGVMAMAANRGYGIGPGETEINLPEVKTGTGSTYKMIALAAAYDAGLTDSDMVFGSACPLYPGGGYDAPPGGFGNSMGCGMQNGVLNARQAAAWSSNTWFVTLGTKIGMDKVLSMTDRLGLSIDEGVTESSLSVILGSSGNSPINMAAAYAAFANQGVYCPATPVKAIKYEDGSSPAIPETYDPTSDSCQSAMSPSAASGVLRAMRANTVPGEVDQAFGLDANIPGYDAVGKSGTNEHLNIAWGQVSPDYSVFIDFYDMDNPNAGISSFLWRGGGNDYRTGAIEGSDVMRMALGARGASGARLDFNNTDRTLKEIAVDTREYFTVPSLIGVTPEEALKTAKSLGIVAEVSKEERDSPAHFPSGLIVEQSIEPGQQLPVGSKKELILYIGK